MILCSIICLCLHIKLTKSCNVMVFKNILILSSLFLLNTGIFAQQNYDQQLINLLETGRFFEANDFYNKYSMTDDTDSVFLPFTRLYYKYETSRMKNQADSAAIFLEKLLEEHEYFGFQAFYFYDKLWTLYVNDLQDYEKAMYTCERMQQFIDENIYEIDEELINEWGWRIGVSNAKKQTKIRASLPLIKEHRSNLQDSVIFTDENILLFDMIYNDKEELTTIFDTGVTHYFVIKRDIADRLGVKKTHVFEDDSTSIINEKKLTGYEGMIDSVEIANVKMYNLPVFVFDFDPLSNVEDSTLNDPKKKERLDLFANSIDVIMGLPTMALIGNIMIDFDNKVLTFPNKTTTPLGNIKEPNLFIYNNLSYTQLEINDIPFTAHVDWGATTYLHIYKSFYERNKSQIHVKTLEEKKPLNIIMMHEAWTNIPYEIPESLGLKFGGKTLPYDESNDIKIYSLPGNTMQEELDGVVGFEFFKKLGKRILFDFKNMRIDVIE